MKPKPPPLLKYPQLFKCATEYQHRVLVVVALRNRSGSLFVVAPLRSPLSLRRSRKLPHSRAIYLLYVPPASPYPEAIVVV